MLRILSQDKRTLITNADYFDIQDCKTTDLKPTIYYHIGSTCRSVAQYLSLSDAIRVLSSIMQSWNTTDSVLYLPQDNKCDIDRFCNGEDVFDVGVKIYSGGNNITGAPSTTAAVYQ